MNAAFYTQVTKKKKPASDIEINRSAEIRQPPIRNDEVDRHPNITFLSYISRC